VYRAIDGHGQIDDVYVSPHRAAESSAAVASDDAAAYPPTLAAILPGAAHETGKAIQQRIERDHQHLKGRLRPLRRFKTLAGARVLCRAHAFLRNLRGRFYDCGRLTDATTASTVPSVFRGWDTPTANQLGH
jgi:transposase-like protein